LLEVKKSYKRFVQMEGRMRVERVENRNAKPKFARLLRAWPRRLYKGLRLRRKYAISSLSCTVGKLVLKYYG